MTNQDEMTRLAFTAEQACHCRPHDRTECSTCWARTRLLNRHQWNLEQTDRLSMIDRHVTRPLSAGAKKSAEVLARIAELLLG